MGFRLLLSPLLIVVLLLIFFKDQIFSSIYKPLQSTLSDINSTEINTKIPISGQNFYIKHIFHNSPSKNIHKRLDITDSFKESILKSFTTDNVGKVGINNGQYIYNDFETIRMGDLDLFNYQSPFSHEFNLNSKKSEILRLKYRDPDFVESYLNYALEVGQDQANKVNLDWQKDTISVPNITDPNTVLTLALMSSDAYAHLPESADWEDVGGNYNMSDSFGWLNDGLRGHIFLSDDNSTVVIAIKGTSAAGIANGDETVENDKTNDNLLFSCCCARVSSLWSTVCDCYEKSYTCNQNCLEKEMRRQDRYYKATLDLYRNVTAMYPKSEVWVTGHSLGGSLSSLLGRTFGLPVVTFEAPGELLPTKRLHLPMPPGFPAELEHIYHFGNTADPIFMGVCNGASSTCSIAGYAMETQCHSGKQCVYDSVNDLGWHVNMLNHRLRTVIDNILKVYNETAECVKPPPCLDCFNWNFVDHSRDHWKQTTTFLSPAPTPTDTDGKKCLKRTWYGRCYKWEGDDGDDGDDDDPSTTSTTSTTSLSVPTKSPTTINLTKTLISRSKPTTKTSSTSTRTTTTTKSSFTSTTKLTTTSAEPECLSWSWLGYCLKYGHKNTIVTGNNAQITSTSA